MKKILITLAMTAAIFTSANAITLTESIKNELKEGANELNAQYPQKLDEYTTIWNASFNYNKLRYVYTADLSHIPEDKLNANYAAFESTLRQEMVSHICTSEDTKIWKNYENLLVNYHYRIKTKNTERITEITITPSLDCK